MLARWTTSALRAPGRLGPRRCLPIVAVCLAALALASPAVATTRRAVLVGIDLYAPATGVATAVSSPPERASTAATSASGRRWSNLEGAVNDVVVVREILVARYGFAPENVVVLTDAAASRAAILDTFRARLVTPARPGDVCVFYFAGHGSQAENADCSEGDCRDETIVPADANQGAADIRDKELQRLFNDVLDRGAVLTVLFDSCYSGSIARGLVRSTRTRSMPPDPRPVPRLPPDPRGPPDARGALVLTASQEFQAADEVVDEQGMHHGLFSLALARSLRTAPVNESARDVFSRVRAIMASNAWRAQEPRLAGTATRLASPLFTAGAATESRTTVAVERIGRDGTCVLQGGLALGLCAGSELCSQPDPATAGADASGDVTGVLVRVRVESVTGPNRCTARVIAGDASRIGVGDLFEPDLWTGCDEPFLRVWMSPPTLARAQLEQIVHGLASIRTSRTIAWVEDPTEATPTHVLAYTGSSWTLTDATTGASVDLGGTPTASAVLERLRPASRSVRLFLNLPPPAELAAELGLAPRDPRSPIDVTPERDAAHYLLTGRAQGRGIEYAWVRPNVSREDSATGCPPLPLRSDWCALDRGGSGTPTCAHQLQDLALRIGKIRTWLQLQSPPEDGRFPYRLGLRDPKSGGNEARTTFHAGEEIQIALWADAEELRQRIVGRYVYVLAIECNGEIETLFPRANETNFVPYTADAGSAPPASIRLETPVIRVSEPYGVDTFVLLTMPEPLPDPAVLSGAPVKTRDASRDPVLARLLAGIGAGTRGIHAPTPADWSVQRLFVRTMPASGGPRR